MAHPPSSRFGANLLPPLGAAAAYAATKSLATGAGSGGLYWQSPAMFSFLAGLLMALALRPLLARVPWTRGTAFGLGFVILFGAGAPGERLWDMLIGSPAIGPVSEVWVRGYLADVLALWVVAGLLAWFFRREGGTIGWANLRARLASRPSAWWAGRVAFLVAAIVGFRAAAGIIGVWAGDGPFLDPLDPTSPWARLAGAGGASPDEGTLEVGLAGVIVAEVGRALLLVLALVPVGLVVRGSRVQLSILFALIVFVLGAFAPLMEQQPYPSAAWLTARVLVSLLAATGIGVAFMIGIGQVRSKSAETDGPPQTAR